MNNRNRTLTNVPVPRIRVRVTRAHIDQAIRAHGGRCMISEAVVDAYESADYVITDLQSVRITDLTKGVRYFYFTPKTAKEQLLAFDRGDMIAPFTFVLREAVVKAAGWQAQRSPDAKRPPAKKQERAKSDKRTIVPPRRRMFGLCLFSDGKTTMEEETVDNA